MTAATVLGSISVVSAQTPSTPQPSVTIENASNEGEVTPLDSIKRVGLKVNEKYVLSGAKYTVISGNTSYIRSEGATVWFTAPDTYVIQVDGWIWDDEYVFTVTK